MIPMEYALRRRMMAGKTARLPKEFQEVEYIQSSGAQYINTGFSPNQDTRVIAEMEYVSHTDQTCGLFGVGIGTGKIYELYHYSGAYTFAYGSTKYTATTAVAIGQKMLIDVSGQRATVNISGVVVDVTPSNSESFADAGTIYIHALHRGSAASFLSYTRTYSFKIYDNGILARDFVPCYRKSDGSVGLYDLVTASFYTNAGMGDFTTDLDGGPEVTRMITLQGNFGYESNSGNGCRVYINGEWRVNPGTYVVHNGDVITLYAGAYGTSYFSRTYISVNGVKVKQATGSTAGQYLQYSHVVASDCTITGAVETSGITRVYWGNLEMTT